MDRIMELINKALGRERMFRENSLVWIDAFDTLAAKPENQPPKPSWLGISMATEDGWNMDEYISHEHSRVLRK